MGAPDPHPLGGSLFKDLKPAVRCHRQIVLRNLVALGQVRVEVILAGELVHRIDGAVQRQPHQDGLFDRFLIDHRHGTWQGCADRTNE